jgi:transcriptional regulator with XRE-family HTH domain
VTIGSLTADDVAASIAARCAALREQHDLSLQEVADRAGLSKSHVWELEQGRSKNPTVDTAVRLARAFGVSLDYMTGLSRDAPTLHPEALRIACEIDVLLRRKTKR